jgi:hypothetical protein
MYFHSPKHYYYKEFCLTGYKSLLAVEINRHLGGTYLLHLQGRRVDQARNQQKTGSRQILGDILLI